MKNDRYSKQPKFSKYRTDPAKRLPAPDMGAVRPIARGDIFFVRNNHAVGHEIQKCRPAVVVSNDVSNAVSSVLQVVFLTSQTKRLGMTDTVAVRCQGQLNAALCGQPASVDRSRLGTYAGHVTPAELSAINKALLFQFQLSLPVQPRSQPEADPGFEPSAA